MCLQVARQLIKRFSIQALWKQFQKVRIDAVNNMSRAMTD